MAPLNVLFFIIIVHFNVADPVSTRTFVCVRNRGKHQTFTWIYLRIIESK